jgi:hypothetical protein
LAMGSDGVGVISLVEWGDDVFRRESEPWEPSAAGAKWAAGPSRDDRDDREVRVSRSEVGLERGRLGSDSARGPSTGTSSVQTLIY